ncbi:MAG TPA: hypothetical protein VGP25_10765 [Gemmatimonadaceae bacterium]|nr:hypothetical protein [Gemmatimonadaceae bacterium]
MRARDDRHLGRAKRPKAMQREGFQVAVRNVADVDQPDVDAGLIEDLAEILLEMPHVVAREETVVGEHAPHSHRVRSRDRSDRRHASEKHHGEEEPSQLKNQAAHSRWVARRRRISSG